MVQYVLLLNYKAAGIKSVRDDPTILRSFEDVLGRFEAKVIKNFHLLGEYDQCLVVDAPGNFKPYRGVLEQELSSTANTEILPAIDIDLFKDIAKRNFHIEGPHHWQIKWWAKIARLAFRWQTTEQYIYKYCKPRTITRRHHFKSLALGSFPIQRGGGSRALEHSHWLLEQGAANLLIFPEGTRSTSRSMARFRHGVSILAIEHGAPVVPCYLTGMNDVRPKGQGQMQLAAVSASFLPPIRFEEGTDVPDATHQIYEALNTVHHRVREEGVAAAVAASEAGR